MAAAIPVRVLALLAAGFACSAAGQHIAFTVDHLDAPGFSARAVKASLNGPDHALQIDIGTLTVGARTWRDARLHCPRLRLERSIIACKDAVLDADGKVSLTFAYSREANTLDATLNVQTNAIVDINVSTYLESPKDDPITLAVTMNRLADGASYTNQSILDAKAKNIRVVVENSGHRPL